jgi:hypothetical protein
VIRDVNFDGFDAVELSTSAFRAVLVYEIGPRIAFFGKTNGENLLYWNRNKVTRNEWKLYGGHRVWLTRPMADEAEDTYLSDNARCALEISGAKVTTTSPAHPVNCLERGMELEIVSESCLRVRNFISNRGSLIYSGGVWSPTCVVPDGRQIIIPLGDDNASWDVVRVVIPRVFAGNSTTLEDNQAVFTGNDLVVTPTGRVLKRCCSAPKGKVLLKCDGYIFEKYSPYDKLLRYPFDGCNVACFVGKDNFMAELETFGGESDIPPGKTIENTEYWSVI